MTKRILVVEDTDDNRAILRDMLTHAGFELIEAEDGETGIKLAKAFRPDLIVMDIQLPTMDGYEVTARIKADPTLKDIPILAVSSYAHPKDSAKAMEVGCAGYVAKPYSPRALLARIREFFA
jgi:two-component system cell cycle response regulator DivK